MATILVLDLPPTSNNLFGHVGKRRYRTQQYENWIAAAGWQLKCQKAPEWTQPVSLLIEVREPPTARREDLDGRAKATIDLLVRHSVIKDDSQAFVRQITLAWSDQIEGVRVTVRPCKD